MQLTFEVDGAPAEFRRNRWTGRSELLVADEVTTLQSPYRFSTHFDWRTQTVWRHRVGTHEVEIVKERPRIVGGMRHNTYRVSVDDTVVSEAEGL